MKTVDSASEPINGWVRQIIPPAKHDQFPWDEQNREVADGKTVVVLNQSRIPSKIDRLLGRLSRGHLGYSIEPEDVPVLLLDEEVADAVRVGERVVVEDPSPVDSKLQRTYFAEEIRGDA